MNGINALINGSGQESLPTLPIHSVPYGDTIRKWLSANQGDTTNSHQTLNLLALCVGGIEKTSWNKVQLNPVTTSNSANMSSLLYLWAHLN